VLEFFLPIVRMYDGQYSNRDAKKQVKKFLFLGDYYGLRSERYFLKRVKTKVSRRLMMIEVMRGK